MIFFSNQGDLGLHTHGFFFFLPPKPLSQERLCDFFFSNQGDLGLHTHGFFFSKPRRPRTTYTWIFFFFPNQGDIGQHGHIYTTDSPVAGQHVGQGQQQQMKVGPCYGIPLNL